MALQAGASSASRLANCGRGVRGSAVQARAGMPSCVVDAPCLFGLCLRCCPCATGTTFRPISWATCLSTCRPCSLRLHLLYCVDISSHAARANQPDAPGLTCRRSLVGTHPSVHALRSVTCPKPLREPMHRLLTLASCLLPLASCLFASCLSHPAFSACTTPLLAPPLSLLLASVRSPSPTLLQRAKATSRLLARPSTAAKPRRGRRL